MLIIRRMAAVVATVLLLLVAYYWPRFEATYPEYVGVAIYLPLAFKIMMQILFALMAGAMLWFGPPKQEDPQRD